MAVSADFRNTWPRRWVRLVAGVVVALPIASCSPNSDGGADGEIASVDIVDGDSWESVAQRLGCDASLQATAGAYLRSANPVFATHGLEGGRVLVYDPSRLPAGCRGAPDPQLPNVGDSAASGAGSSGPGSSSAVSQPAAPESSSAVSQPAAPESSSAVTPPSSTASSETGSPTTADRRVPPTFVETFDTPESLDRFDYGVHHAWIANPTDDTWIGDHDLDCGPPEPGRTITNPTRIDGTTYYPDMREPVVYWCREHLMTTFNTNHYAQVNFSPKQVFEDVKRVCWDQNRTDVGRRMWTQVVVVPIDTFEANDGRLDYVANRLSPQGPGMFGIHPTDGTFMIELTDGGSRAQTGQFVDEVNEENWTTTDKATRYQVCIEDLGDGSVRMEIEGDSGLQVRTLRGSIPGGRARVIFQHDLYNPDKDPGVANGYTWHWDDVEIGTA